ncbi:hypothetical protein [Lactiplantibacillus plajomi]|uniref:Uncharacterized protein n=1 Tax=Lactiplantibacillus plajomi TaxID=1457217 RepID=A0ABV6K6J0_9LACO|nr:hypothetical protein [Lactiplantibacillus plajomi]
MSKQVAGTIIQNDEQGTRFLVTKDRQGAYCFYHLTVRDGQSPLASMLYELRHSVGIEVDRLRLYDSSIAMIGDEKVDLFVFNHVNMTAAVEQRLAQHNLFLVPARALHELFRSVNVGQTSPMEDFYK